MHVLLGQADWRACRKRRDCGSSTGVEAGACGPRSSEADARTSKPMNMPRDAPVRSSMAACSGRPPRTALVRPARSRGPR